MALLKMTSSPHLRSETRTSGIMADVLIALVPALIWSVYIFGWRSLTLTLIGVISCVLSEYFFELITKRPVTVGDLSAVVTGVLITFSCPPAVPLWIPAVAGVFAIVVVKQLFGGIGMNIVNPALAARIFIFLSWPSQMKIFSAPFLKLPALSMTVDTVTSATPLEALKIGEIPTSSYRLFDLLMGNKAGCIGEVSVLLILAGGLYLLYRKVISWHIPVSFLATVALITAVMPKGLNVLSFDFMLYELCSGGLVIGAVFMATDYTTSPLTDNGKLIFGVGCGLITVFIRYFGGYPEGVSFAILIMNLLVGYIDKLTKPRAFGTGGALREQKKAS